MKDYELIGIPQAVVIGKKLVDGQVEFITRAGMVKEEVASGNILNVLKERM